MRCPEHKHDLIELARGGAARRGLLVHLESCAACARFLEDQIVLSHAMQSIAAAKSAPSSALAARIMSEFQPRRMPAWRGAAAACIAMAACLSAFWLLYRAPAPPPTAAAPTPPFVTIPYTVPLAPDEPAAVWHTQIPVSALIAVGYHVAAADPSAVVDADILVSQDGRARAIRTASISI